MRAVVRRPRPSQDELASRGLVGASCAVRGWRHPRVPAGEGLGEELESRQAVDRTHTAGQTIKVGCR